MAPSQSWLLTVPELRLGQAALQATYLERDLRDHPEKLLELI